MRKSSDILRLRLQGGLSLREVHRSLRLSLGAVQGITSRADKLKLTWADIKALDGQQLVIQINDSESRLIKGCTNSPHLIIQLAKVVRFISMPNGLK